MDISFFLSNVQHPLTESIIQNTLLSVLLVILGLFDGIFGFVEFLDNGGPIKLLFKAGALTVAIIMLCIFVKLVFALLLIVIAVFLMILCKARKRSKKNDEQVGRAIGDEEISLPQDSGLTASLEYKQATKCIAGKCPKEAITYLLRCRGKIIGKPKFFISYAEALMLLENFHGALAKLNSISSKRLKKRKVFIKVTVRKAQCYHGLNEYVKELECYNALLARNIQPAIYYFRRSQVKLRMLEVAPCLKPVEQAIADASSPQQSFIEGIFEDLDKALYYSKQESEDYEGKILSYKGACHIHAKAYEEGWGLLTEARKKNEFYPNTYVYLGIYQYTKKNPTQAIGEFRKAISYGEEADAASDVAFYYLAKIYYEMDKYDNAIRCAAQSLSIFSYRSECFSIQGNCYQNKLMYTEAIECYTKAIELKPEAKYYESRAHCYYNRHGESKKAYDDIQEAIRLNDLCRYQLNAQLYKADMDQEKGIQKDKAELDKLLAPFQDDSGNFVSLGIIYSKYQYFEESQQYYRKAIEKDPESSTAYFDLALLLRGQGLNSEAIKELDFAIKLEPMNVKYYKVLAKCYRDMNDPINEALTLVRLTEVNQTCCEINKSSGDAVYQLNRYQTAVKHYQAALVYSLSPAVLNNLACAYYAQELYEDAIENLEKAIEVDKQYFLAYFNLGNCQLRMSQNGAVQDMEKMAKANFKAAVSLNAEFEQASFMLKSMDAENIEMIIDAKKHR